MRLLILLLGLVSQSGMGNPMFLQGHGVLSKKNVLLTQHRIFASSTLHQGNFGGLAVADSICNSLGKAQFGAGTTWKAIISDGSTNAIDRIYVNGPVYNTRGSPQLLASNEADLWDGAIGGSGIDFEEDGSAAEEASVLTATNTNGTRRTNHCSNWTSTAGTFHRGRTGDTNGDWIADSSTMNCTFSGHLFCIDQ